MEKTDIVKVPLIKESPVNIECLVKDVKALGSHDMFIAQVAAVHADEKYDHRRVAANSACPCHSKNVFLSIPVRCTYQYYRQWIEHISRFPALLSHFSPHFCIIFP